MSCNIFITMITRNSDSVIFHPVSNIFIHLPATVPSGVRTLKVIILFIPEKGDQIFRRKLFVSFPSIDWFKIYQITKF